MRKRDFYLLFSYQGANLEFIIENSKYPLQKLTSPKRVGTFKRWLCGALGAIRSSKRGDVIVCFLDMQGVLLFWLCRFMLCRREIFAINLLLKDKQSRKNKLAKFLYRQALRSRHFHASVTSMAYGEWIKDVLGVNADLSLVRDVCLDYYAYAAPPVDAINLKSVICAGRNGRDWDLIVNVAKKMTSVNFNLVMPQGAYNRLHDSFPHNVNAYAEIEFSEYKRMLAESMAVCLPLETEAPAGLMVVFQAALNEKPVFISETVTSQEYVTPETGYPLPNDVDAWVQALDSAFKQPAQMLAKANRLHDYIKMECSQDNYVKQIDTMIDKYVSHD